MYRAGCIEKKTVWDLFILPGTVAAASEVLGMDLEAVIHVEHELQERP